MNESLIKLKEVSRVSVLLLFCFFRKNQPTTGANFSDSPNYAEKLIIHLSLHLDLFLSLGIRIIVVR